MSTVRVVAKNTMALFLAELISKAASIVYFAILARYILVEGVGQISAGQAVVYSLIVVVSFGLDQLLIREVSAEKRLAETYVGTVVLLRLLLTGVFVVLLTLAVSRLGYSWELSTITYLYAANAVLRVFSDVALDVFKAHERMEINLVVRVTRDLANVALSLIAIWMGAGIVIIVAVSVVASILELAMSWVLLARTFGRVHVRWDPELSKRLMIAAIPFVLVSGVYPAVQWQFSTVVLSATADATDLGRFAAANTIVGLLMLVPSIFTQAMYPVFSRLGGRDTASPVERLRLAYRKTFGYLFVLGLAVSVGVYLTSDRILPIVLGDSFAKAAPAMGILAWLPAVTYVGYGSGNFLTAVGRERLFMVTEGAFVFVQGLLTVVLTPRYGFLGACWVMLGSAASGLVFYTVLCHRLLGLSLPWRTMGASLAAVLGMAAVVRWALAQGINVFAVGAVLAPAVYAAGLLLLRAVTAEDLALLRRAFRPT